MPTRRSALHVRLDHLLERFVAELTEAIQSASIARAAREAPPPARAHVATRASDSERTTRASALGQRGVREGSVNAQLVALLRASPDRAFHADELARALGRGDKARSVSAALAALAGRGLVARVGDGVYAAPGGASRTSKQDDVVARVDGEEASPNRVLDAPCDDSVGDVVPEVSDPQALLDALERGSTPAVAVTTNRKSETVATSAAPSAGAGREEAAPPPPVRGDEVAVRTRAGAYVIRRRRAAAAA